MWLPWTLTTFIESGQYWSEEPNQEVSATFGLTQRSKPDYCGSGAMPLSNSSAGVKTDLVAPVLMKRRRESIWTLSPGCGRQLFHGELLQLHLLRL